MRYDKTNRLVINLLSYQALTVLTVSDHINTGEVTTSEERQTTFNDMMLIALEAAIQV